MEFTLDAVAELNKDLKKAARLMEKRNAKFLVYLYYSIQKFRVSSGNQIHSMANNKETPDVLMQWMFDNMKSLESNIKRALNEFAKSYTIGRWLQSICGIGPVISAGLLANFDITKAPTNGHFQRFCGIDPTIVWNKGEKRPYNAQLKTLVVFKAGESFVKVQGKENDFYGKLFKAKKEKEKEELKNQQGGFVEFAKLILEKKKIGKTTEAYKYYSQGMLPKAHIHARARRSTVRLFVCHLHQVMFEDYYGTDAPGPYPIELLKHAHFIPPPNYPFDDKAKSLKEMK